MKISNFNKYKILLIYIISVQLLVACGEDIPGAKLAADTVHSVASTDVREGLEIADYIRENGWVDSQNPNQYNVRFKYNLKLVKSYPEVVLSNAKLLNEEIFSSSKGSGLNALASVSTLWSYSTSVNQWVANQGVDYKPRYQKFLGNCTPCVAYWNSKDAPKEVTQRRITFVISWIYYESIGFKDDAAVGSGVPRQASSSFIKTENGWLPVQ